MQIELYSQEHYLAAATGVVPAFAAMLLFDYIDRKRPEPWRLRYGVTFLGMLSVIPVLFLAEILDAVLGASKPSPDSYAGAALTAFGTAAGLEELCKIMAVFLLVWKSKAFDERMDGIVYGARAGLGFALVENCLYIYVAIMNSGGALDGSVIMVWVLRAVLAVPGHAIWTGAMGYCAARSRFDNAGPGIIGGFLIAVALHGLYDFTIFLNAPLNADGMSTLAGLLLLGPVVLTIVGWVMIQKMAHVALRGDDAAAARASGAAFA